MFLPSFRDKRPSLTLGLHEVKIIKSAITVVAARLPARIHKPVKIQESYSKKKN